ncbi:ATP-grasp domain-containing protein [Sabulilitoribacter arenilitoris]|uniref:ATP-grasp domain-containing protein n=1 Tax=Wocania arenilitoris TaxID=2044858 RepID=A0AAE3ER79_9FLAO|nr:ATP-grasp domain-containing protein [Wocania arenilitoris]MCF7568620.1 ATP-grasp domain-containing protein [Wocania arenilitoris]
MIDRNISVLIPDGEAPVLMIVLNCLSEVRGIKIHVMSDDNEIPMKHSNKVHKFSFYPKTTNTDFINHINKEVDKYNIDVIMPIFEDAIRVILEHKDLISSINKLALLPSYENFNTANNKGLLNKHLAENNLPFPKTQMIDKGVDFDIKTVDFPVLVKPAEGIGGGNGIDVFRDKSGLNEFLNSDKFNCTYLIQDYVEGYDIDCSVLCKNGEILAYTIQKPNMFGNSKYAPQISFEFLENDVLFKDVEKLMKTLNWSGVAHLDMRYDKNANNFKVIEVNPRFWGSVEASLFAGVNFPYLYAAASLGYEFDMPKYKFIDFMLMKGLVKSIKNDKSYLFKLNFIFKHTPMKYMLNDLKPTFYRFSRFFMRKIRPKKNFQHFIINSL